MSRIRMFEEISLNSWPAIDSRFRDGWIIRCAGGYTNRANSVYPLYETFEALNCKIEEVKSFYNSRGLPPMFKLTSDSKPACLDNVLGELGFEEKDRALVMTKIIAGQSCDLSDLDVLSSPEDRWLELFFSLNRRARENQVLAKRLLTLLPPKSTFVLLKKKREFVGCGFAVIQSAFLGLFGIAVRETERRKGYGREMTEKLLEVGRKRGAKIAYLQVDEPNISAISLYSKIGFHEEYQYWYRVGE